MNISKINHEDGTLEFDKQATVECAAKIHGWIVETEERVLIETLALNGSKDALLRLRGVIDKALEKYCK